MLSEKKQEKVSVIHLSFRFFRLYCFFKKKMKGIIIIGLLICQGISLAAQNVGDTILLQGFDLKWTKSNHPTGTLSIALPFGESQTLSDAISSQTSLFVKQYSPSNLATVSMRGMGAQHTSMLWNGINLQSCMNGLKDLNLIPLFFIDDATIETGANSSLMGHGTIAGTVQLRNHLESEKRIKLDINKASFNNQSIGFSIAGANKLFKYRTRFVYRSGENDFEFINYFKKELPKERIQNNQLNQLGLMQEFSWQYKKHAFYFNSWLMQTSRNLPTPMGVVNNANEYQEDFNYKFYFQHQFKISAKSKLSQKLCYIDEYLNYYNNALLPALSRSKSVIVESEWNMQLNANIEITGNGNFTHQIAFADGYQLGVNRSVFSLFQRVDWYNNARTNKVSFSLRELMYENKIAPLSPELGLEKQLSKKWLIKSNAALSFRLPTFNDLYWQPGGNVNLLPEKGRKIEFSTLYRSSNWEFSVTAFKHVVDNWIMWLPMQGASVWIAQNAKQVKSNGIEFNQTVNKKILQKHHLKAITRYQFVKTINTKSYHNQLVQLGKQLIYTPNHTAVLNIDYQFNNFNWFVENQYIGIRFANADQSIESKLDDYLLFNSGVSYRLYAKKYIGTLAFTARNIFNTNYQVMENRPMPLRNYQLTLKININYDKKNQL